MTTFAVGISQPKGPQCAALEQIAAALQSQAVRGAQITSFTAEGMLRALPTQPYCSSRTPKMGAQTGGGIWHAGGAVVASYRALCSEP